MIVKKNHTHTHKHTLWHQESVCTFSMCPECPGHTNTQSCMLRATIATLLHSESSPLPLCLSPLSLHSTGRSFFPSFHSSRLSPMCAGALNPNFEKEGKWGERASAGGYAELRSYDEHVVGRAADALTLTTRSFSFGFVPCTNTVATWIHAEETPSVHCSHIYMIIKFNYL